MKTFALGSCCIRSWVYAFNSFLAPTELGKGAVGVLLFWRLWAAGAHAQCGSASRLRGWTIRKIRFDVQSADLAELDKVSYWNRNMGARLPGPPRSRVLPEIS